MKRIASMFAAGVCAFGAWGADGAAAAGPEEADAPAGFRLSAGGFARGDVRGASGGAKDRAQLYGPEADVLWNAWEAGGFRLWLGAGGAVAPERRVLRGRTRTATHERRTSDDGYATYDFSSSDARRRTLDAGFGEVRLVAEPEWRVTEAWSVAGRLGVAFDWVRARSRYARDWSWRSSFDFDIPGVPPSSDRDGDSGGERSRASETAFTAQGILGLKTTYMFTDSFGVYALCDWRLGEKLDVGSGASRATVDLSGWYAAAGVVVEF